MTGDFVLPPTVGFLYEQTEGCKKYIDCVLQTETKVGPISKAAFRRAFVKGQTCHIWSRNTDFKGHSP